MARRVMTPRVVRCKFGCGATVFRFTDDIGLEHQADVSTLDIPSSHPSVRHRLWRYRSPWVGWISVPYLGKEVSPTLHGQLHTEHDCDKTPTIRRPCTCGDNRVHTAHTKPKPIRNEQARTQQHDRGSF